MSERFARVLPILVLVACVIVSPVAADGSIEGVWLGVSSKVGSVYRLELDPGGSGNLQYVSHVGEQPEVRSYTVRAWELDGDDLDLDLEPLDGAPSLRLRGKLRSGQLDFEIVRRNRAKTERLRMSPERRFLDDLALIRDAAGGA